MNPRSALVRLLADGALHDAKSLARAAGIDQGDVAVCLDGLRDWRVEVESQEGRGYRLPARLELLDAAVIERLIGERSGARLAALEVLDEVDSTNARVLMLPLLEPGRGRACLSEFQTAGRGRRGREWLQPYAAGLSLSLGWSFARDARLDALGLAAGVAVLRALDGFGVPGLALKWPNDVLRNGRKLGGILCELRTAPDRPAQVAIGVGLNGCLDDSTRAAILDHGGLEPADLGDLRPRVERNRLAARLLEALIAMAAEFAARGFAPFADEWRAADALQGRAVQILGTPDRQGIARGIDPDGALCIEVGGRLERLMAGDVTLRAVA